jgi:hypothetical protein
MLSVAPRARQVLEQLIYRVKIMATSLGAGEAFNMGVLKNRALDGTEIPHESSEEEEEEEEDEEVEEMEEGSEGGEREAEFEDDDEDMGEEEGDNDNE